MPRPSTSACATVLAAIALATGVCGSPTGAAANLLQPNDLVAFVGGASVVATDQSGILETALTVAHPGSRLRFRSLAWEGDTVFSQPRELNFPPATNLLRRLGATVVCSQFGSLEALDPNTDPQAFVDAYDRLLDTFATVTPRLILVIPPPFEPQPPPLPDLRPANQTLDRLAAGIRSLAAQRQLPLVDLHHAFAQQAPPSPWTFNGSDLNPAGQRAVAAAWIRALDGPTRLANQISAAAFWTAPDLADLRTEISRKNRLWFDSWRPMNWAFLAGDRTEQQASRDHRDPRIRWFPAEMERFPPLIREAEIRIESLARQVRLEP